MYFRENHHGMKSFIEFIIFFTILILFLISSFLRVIFTYLFLKNDKKQKEKNV